MDLLSNLMAGMSTVLTPITLMYCFLGVLLGTAVGVLPGIGALATISLLLPITYYIPPTPAIIMLAGVYYGAQYGGSTAAILLNLPGTPTSAVACLDGYPMSRQGRAGVALFMTTIASFVGAMFGLVLLISFAPAIVELALVLGSAEYFTLMLLGLMAASTLASGSLPKSLAMVVLGLLLGTIGTDINTGIDRFTFGFYSLMDGLSIIALAMGVFGIAEVISNVNNPAPTGAGQKISLRSMLPTRQDWRDSAWPMLRGSGVGAFFGALPGTGASISSFMAYAFEKKLAADPARFGQGAIEGVSAPEAANNASVQTAFVPTLTLGIPGDVVMALMLGALIMHGITPGPLLMLEQPELFWGLIASFVVGNIMLLVLNIPLIGVWVSLLRIPYRVLYPVILIFISLGVYSAGNNIFDIYMVAVIGALGYAMSVFRFQPAPLLLGFILGPMMEESFRRTMLLSRGELMIFFERPISATILTITLAMLAWAIARVLYGAYRQRSVAAAAAKDAQGL
ncbi:MAG: tripartite tricarboxylate transporter permease [Aquisalimonadaceae bacterium]